MGVQRTAKALRSLGLREVHTLPLATATTGAVAAEAEVAGGDAKGDEPAVDDTGPGGVSATWAKTAVYVASERWGRGLDLQLGYVFQLAPPASSASYMHLAGRTGRQGADGVAVTLVTHRQAPRLAAFARDLGVAFEPLGSDGGAGDDA